MPVRKTRGSPPTALRGSGAPAPARGHRTSIGARCARQSRPGIGRRHGPRVRGPAQIRPASRPRPWCWLRLRGGKFLLPRGTRRPGHGRSRRRPGRPRAQAAADRGMRHPQPPADLRIRQPLTAPAGRVRPVRLCQLAGPARPRIADQRRRPLPQRRVVQGGDIAFGQPQHRRDPPAGEPQLPQRRKSHVAHHRVRRVVAEQRSAAHGDHAPAIGPVQAQVAGHGHALQHRRHRRRHASILPEF